MIEIRRKKQQAAESPAERAPVHTEGLETRDYRAMYRAAFEFHERHNPPQVDRGYWQTHTPGIDDAPQLDFDYWEKAAQDMCDVSNSFDNDKFIMALLCAVYNELDREYQKAQQAANNLLSAE